MQVSTGRRCSCGEEIHVTEKTAAFGATHNRDPKTWPARCAFCILDTTIAMFDSIGAPPTLTAPPEKICDHCRSPLGAKFYAAVPGKGDLCLVCHAIWVKGPQP